MRLWLVDPKVLCRKHILGEHFESHLFVGALNKGKTIKGFLDKGLLEIHSIKKRHDELAQEMIARGMKHNSPLPEFKEQISGKINVEENYKELSRRCEHCGERIEHHDY